MTQLYVRKMSGDKYNYINITNKFSKDEIDKYSKWISNGISRNINNELSVSKKSEWITRNYLACKMIYSASVMASSLVYAYEHNLKICIPYLSYYAVFTACRAFIFTLPDTEWSEQGLLKIKHSKLPNIVKDALMKLNKEYALEFTNEFNDLRENRELFSYSFPASGLEWQPLVYNYDDILDLCQVLCELAQLNSEKLEECIDKNYLDDVNKNYEQFDFTYINRAAYYNDLIDNEDAYRITYRLRKQPKPLSLYFNMTEGMTEDFFGSWCGENDNEENYNPNLDWKIIFQVP